MFDTEDLSESNKRSKMIEGKKKSGGFQSMGFSWQVLKSILNSGYKQPTPIQRKAIPEILLGKDVVAMARTGSGKTAAFLLPMFQRLQENKSQKAGPRALVMSPTRELALQTFKFTKQFGKYSDFKAAVILGGDKIEDQFETMHENPDIIIATPGRFLHICVEMSLKLNSIEYVVFDEADRLFEMGFKEQLNEILSKLPVENRQTLLFSATLPQSLVEFARAGLQNPTLIRLDVESKLSDKLKMAFFQCRIEDKLPFLIYLLNNVIKSVKNPSDFSTNKNDEKSLNRLEQTIIFVATKHHVEFLKDLLESLGYSVSYAYSSLDQTARQINIAKFQQKKTSIMIVTDVAARGIDIPMLDNVINFNFPAKAKLYVHRVGRVARAGNYGNSFSMITSDELPYMHELFEFLSKQIRFANDTMAPEDWNEVYGSIPQEIIDIEKDTIKSFIESKIELKCAFEVQENAYKHYLKSRPLANSSNVRAAKNIRIMHPVLSVHPFLKNNSDLKSSFEAQADLLDKLKNYKTKTTIFEINKTSNQQSAEMMRKKRQQHDKIVEKFKQRDLSEDNVSLFQKNIYSIQRNMFSNESKLDEINQDDQETDNDDNMPNDDDFNTKTTEYDFENDDLVIKVTNNDEKENDVEVVGKKRKRTMSNGISKADKRKQQKSIIDAEHFIPYKPNNFNTEKALGINTNFNREIADATLDIVADDQTDMHRNLQKTKWDRKKKKFVSLQSTLEKTKKIKTESGNYINASYKSNLYSKWLKNNKALDRNDDDDNDDGGENLSKKKYDKKNKKFFGSSTIEKKYFGNKKNKKSRPGQHKRKQQSEESSSTSRTVSSSKQGKRFNSFTDQSNGKTNKRFSTGLKSKDQIMKERRVREKKQAFQNKKKGGKSGGGGKKGWKPRNK